jgi:hypothetical protein
MSEIINWRASIVAALRSDAPAQSSENAGSEEHYGSVEGEVGVVLRRWRKRLHRL